MMIFDIFSCTYGVGLYGSSKSTVWQKIRKIFLNPNIIAIIIGLILFIFSIHLPVVVNQFLGYVSDAFTPLSMIVIGSNLSNMELKDIKLPGYLWLLVLLRNLIYPIMTGFVLRACGLIRVPLMATIILSACPFAGGVSWFSLQTHGDAKAATVAMSVSTLLSLVTITVVFALLQNI